MAEFQGCPGSQTQDFRATATAEGPPAIPRPSMAASRGPMGFRDSKPPPSCAAFTRAATASGVPIRPSAR